MHATWLSAFLALLSLLGVQLMATSGAAVAEAREAQAVPEVPAVRAAPASRQCRDVLPDITAARTATWTPPRLSIAGMWRERFVLRPCGGVGDRWCRVDTRLG